MLSFTARTFDPALGLLERDFALHRLQRDEPRAAADPDVAVGGLDADVSPTPSIVTSA
jgi:hypothetical protein